MEKFFIVEPEDKIFKTYMARKEDYKCWNIAFEMLKNIGVKHNGIILSKDGKCGDPITKDDSLNLWVMFSNINEDDFNDLLGKRSSSGLRKVKVRTQFYKELKTKLIEQGYKNVSKLNLRDYFGCDFMAAEQIYFLYEGKLYCKFKSDTLTEYNSEFVRYIKGSEFYVAMEEVQEREKDRSNKNE